jgi:hypothetical protein
MLAGTVLVVGAVAAWRLGNRPHATATRSRTRHRALPCRARARTHTLAARCGQLLVVRFNQREWFVGAGLVPARLAAYAA